MVLQFLKYLDIVVRTNVLPYPNTADRWTNAKRQMDQEWYYWQTTLKFVQTYGRSIRSKEDWAKTYVLDSAFASLPRKNKNMFPDWVTRAIIDKL